MWVGNGNDSEKAEKSEDIKRGKGVGMVSEKGSPRTAVLLLVNYRDQGGKFFLLHGNGVGVSSAGGSLGHCMPLLISGQRYCWTPLERHLRLAGSPTHQVG